jgi:hypothetical protein
MEPKHASARDDDLRFCAELRLATAPSLGEADDVRDADLPAGGDGRSCSHVGSLRWRSSLDDRRQRVAARSCS